MKNETKDNKSCENCRYYYQHYVKLDTNFKGIACGHCINQNNKK